MFNFISFSYISTSENLKADKLAKLSLGLHSDVLGLLVGLILSFGFNTVLVAQKKIETNFQV